MDTFEYPLELRFENVEQHLKHIKDNLLFYGPIVQKDLATEIDQLGKKLEFKEEEVQESKKQLNEAEKLDAIKIQSKEEEIDRLKIKLVSKEEEVQESKKQLKKAEKLDATRTLNAMVQPTTKGRTFEQEIKYTLEKIKKEMGFEDYWIVQGGKNMACDIRIHWGSSIVGIEAKSKITVNKQDLVKFDRDRNENQFTGAVFWSRIGKIPSTKDTGENDTFMEMMNNCLYIRGDDFQRIGQMIFVYINFLNASSSKSGDDTAFLELIRLMFNMMLDHYQHLGSLKKEVLKVDRKMKKDLLEINQMCRKQKIKDVPSFEIQENDLFLGPKKDFKHLPYGLEESNSRKQQHSIFKYAKHPKKRTSEDFFGAESSPKKPVIQTIDISEEDEACTLEDA